jgi:hypothetical protein
LTATPEPVSPVIPVQRVDSDKRINSVGKTS